MAIRRYYLAQAGFEEGFGRVAAPKVVIDNILMEKYHWTPQQIDDIPKEKMDEMILLLNARLNADAEIQYKSKAREEIKKKSIEKNPKVIGSGIRDRRPV